MNTLSLDGKWDFRKITNPDWLEGNVPGSILADLYGLNLIEEPYNKNNEQNLYDLFNDEYEYRKRFTVSEVDLNNSEAVLQFAGIDTLSTILINGSVVGTTSNMHRTYEFKVKKHLKIGRNEIVVKIQSPTKYINEKQKQQPLYGIPMAIPGYTHLRKGHYMFGWDWGPKLPDCGIWRSVTLFFISDARWLDIQVKQYHEDSYVGLCTELSIEKYSVENAQAIIILITPDGKKLEKKKLINQTTNIELRIDDPKLWWPNGYGEQPLYQLECILESVDQVILDKKILFIGLRKISVNTTPDQWGKNFAFCINGTEIFAMGADYIPEDNILSWSDNHRTDKLIKDCVKANFNMIRVWGGGIYPDNNFYELCDKYGLIVWQDLMFACGVYDLEDSNFINNALLEIKDNIKRIRHHACVGLLCGNNEIEMFFDDGRIQKTEKNEVNYIRFFEDQIPRLIKHITKEIFYWPSSPSSGGNFFETNGENSGDGHYWDVWHGNQPFTAYRETYFRFMSEFGFQSLPDLSTIESFTEPEDRNLFSYIMETHQKNPDGNTKILTYLANNYQNPKDFSSLVYTSQILQAEAMRYGVEHWRRNRGRCMGTLYWQLNDCWPTSSWSSVDYYGRWKALHYAAKKFYAPILLSAKEDGTTVEFHISNETLQEWSGKVTCYLMKQNGDIIHRESLKVKANKLSSRNVLTKHFNLTTDEYRDVFVYYKLEQNEKKISSGSVLFVPDKHFNYQSPKLMLAFSENVDSYVVKVQSQSLARFVELKVTGIDVVFSENYFDLPVGEEQLVFINKKEFSEISSLKFLRENLVARSYFNSYQ
jgi:beta-mannosidase